MYRIGLTGNIATGKSLVLRRLAALGAYCLDADRLAHEAILPGTEPWHAIRARFGEGVVLPDGSIDRASLGRIVFADGAALTELEGIIHPWVVAEAERRLQVRGAAVTVIEAIKLLEASMGSRCQAIWVTACARDLQVERLMRYRRLSEADAIARVDAQPPAGAKAARADVLLENDATLDEIVALVDAEWREIAEGHAPGRDTSPGAPVRRGETWRVDEAATWAEARPAGGDRCRLTVSHPARMPRLCRALLPALERDVCGADGTALLIAARTGYRQCLSGMGYEEVRQGGGDEGESEFRRAR